MADRGEDLPPRDPTLTEDPLHRIGELSALTGLTVKTLRYYDDIGLLAPATVDRSSGYRRYSDLEVDRGRQIVALKQLGFSLDEIARALDARAATRAVLEEARRRLVTSLEQQRRELARVEAELVQLDEIRLTRMPALRIASIRDRIVAYDDADELTRELRRGARGIGVQGAIWHQCGDGLEAEVFVEVAPGTAVRGRARLGELPATTAARAAATDDDWPEAYARLARWVPANGYRRAGPKRELHTTDPFTGACCLEILVPVDD